MFEKSKLYKVKPGKLIIHGGEQFSQGMELYLVEAVAKVHGDSLEEIQPQPAPTAKRKPKAEAEDVTE